MANRDPRKVIIGSTKVPARSSFMFCRTLKEDEKNPDAPARGTSAILFPKSDKAMYKRVVAAIMAAGEKKFGEGKYNMDSKRLSSPLRDGDELADDPEYSVGDEARGHWFISSSCYKVPQLAESQGGEIVRVVDPAEIEDKMCSGNYFAFSVTMKGFANESKGVRCELQNLLFIKEGDRLDGSTSAESDFAEYAMDDDGDDSRDFDDEDDTPKKSKKKKDKSGKKDKSEDRAARRAKRRK